VTAPTLRAEVAVPQASRSATSRIAAVDGLRALAVLAVIAFHFGLPLSGGFLGVDLFFVISGFVITRLLLVERAGSGQTSLVTFWTRRARRLLPAALAVLVCVQAWTHWTAPPSLRGTTNGQTLAALVYGSNWYAILDKIGYWDADALAAPLGHLWSLAVEEQFYLVWPLVFVLAARLARPRAALAAAATLGVVCSYTLLHLRFVPGDISRAYLGTDCRTGALALGCLLATVLHRIGPDTRPPSRWTTPPALAAVGVLGWLWCTSDLEGAALYTWQLPVAGVAAAALITTLVLNTDGLPARLVGSRPLVAIGKASYSLYLWHWPLWVFLEVTFPLWTTPARLVAASLGTSVLAIASHRLLETPLRHAQSHARMILAGLVTVMLALAASATLCQPDVPVEQQDSITITGP
jgi:peptidoglycan/LPS O-acetylase OafA/YrhL